MLSHKIIHAQIAAICYEREARGEPVFELYACDSLHDVPDGALCIHSDIVLKEDDELPDFKRVAHEPLMLATDETYQFIMLHKEGSLNLFDLNNLDCNWKTNEDEDDEPEEYYVLVIKDLNFALTDSRASAITHTVISAVGKQMSEKLDKLAFDILTSQPSHPKKLEFL